MAAGVNSSKLCRCTKLAFFFRGPVHKKNFLNTPYMNIAAISTAHLLNCMCHLSPSKASSQSNLHNHSVQQRRSYNPTQWLHKKPPKTDLLTAIFLSMSN